MIEKIIKIQNIGRFLNYSCSGDMALKKLVLYYAENGQGKTTLSAIIRSLFTNNPRLIQERRSLGQSGDQLVSLKVDGKTVEFKNDSWNQNFSDIILFDPLFVSQNVYAGDFIEHEHKKNLYNFAIGEEGVRLAESIVKIDEDNRNIINPTINAKRTEIGRKIIGQMDIDKFISLNNENDIDNSIKTKEKEVETQRRSEIILSKPLFSKLSLPSIDIDKVKKILIKELEGILSDTEKRVKEHILGCMDKHGENWINQGLQYVKENKCPFCGRVLEGIELIKAYQVYFSNNYKTFKEEIRQAKIEFNGIFSQDKVFSLQKNIENNKSLLEFWKEYIEFEPVVVSFDNLKSSLDLVYSLITTQLDLKISAPLEKIEIGSDLIKALEDFGKLGELLDRYNLFIGGMNQKAKTKQEVIGKSNLQQALGELNKLQNIKERFSQETTELVEEYQKILDDKREKEKIKNETRKRLKELTDNLLSKYQEKINDYLEKFGAGFRIVETSESYAGGRPSISYRISINNIPVDLDATTNSIPKPSFSNTLSSGDKSALAFAFFLSRLDLEGDLDKKIVIFDDPITSLDIPRRNCTRQQLLRFSNLAKQVIILSHDLYFLGSVWRNMTDKSKVRTLYMKRRGQGVIIDLWDVEKETQGEYFRNYNALIEYLENGPNGDLRAVAFCIRALLECNLRMRFPGSFKKGDWLGDMLRTIRESSSIPPLSKIVPALLTELSEINDYSKQFHHDQNPNADSHPINDTELTSYINRTIKVISGVLSGN